MKDIQSAVNEALEVLRTWPEDSPAEDLNEAINEALEILSKFETK